MHVVSQSCCYLYKHCVNIVWVVDIVQTLLSFFFFFLCSKLGGEFNTKATKKGYERLFCGLVRAEDVIEVEYNGVGNTLCG